MSTEAQETYEPYVSDRHNALIDALRALTYEEMKRFAQSTALCLDETGKDTDDITPEEIDRVAQALLLAADCVAEGGSEI